MGQFGFFDADRRLAAITAKGGQKFDGLELGQHVIGRVCGQRVSFGGDRGGAQLARPAQLDSSSRESQSSAIAGAGKRSRKSKVRANAGW
jgi:hypothetical protein